MAGELGFNHGLEHHFRGSLTATRYGSRHRHPAPADRYLGFGVISPPEIRWLVESMNLLDQLMKGRTLFGMGSGFSGSEPLGLGVGADYHASGKATQDTLAVMQRLWAYRTGDPEYVYELPTHRGTIRRRVVPAPYHKRHPTIVRTASRDAAVADAARNGWPAFLGTFGCESPLIDQTGYIGRRLPKRTIHPEVSPSACAGAPATG